MTNYEKIKAMSVKEMAKWIDIANSALDPCNYCKYYANRAPHCRSMTQSIDCVKAIANYLEREVDENMLPEICSCGYRFETDETICPNCGKKVEEDG